MTRYLVWVRYNNTINIYGNRNKSSRPIQVDPQS